MHPVLFHLGALEIRVYGVLAAISFLTAIYFATVLSKKEGFKYDMILDLGLVVIISSVIGARLLYVITEWGYFAKNPAEIIMVWKGGLVFYGGFISAALGGIWWLKRQKLPVMKIADISIPFVALAHAIGRIGCYFNGCCYGKVHKLGVIFPEVGDNLPHLPTQLYESGLNFINFIVLILFYRYFKKSGGQVFFLYFFNYGIIRFIIEFFRGDPRGVMFGLPTSMFISILIFLTGVIGLIVVSRKKAA